ncbi:MAG: ShlB/FhaC/HecB family hemolysin secretion/activation protein [Phycisphaeraceae bacterium]|nr:ShlB/FhaC/HecB family hemolysin secretion/activation protein [Phycisphaeraceae bacterium]
MQKLISAFWLVVAFSLLCVIGVVEASPPDPSVDPGAIRRAERDALENLRLQRRLTREEREEAEIDAPDRDPADLDMLSDAKVIQVTRFELDPSTILSPADLAPILDPLKGRTVSIRELFSAVDQINGLYDLRGYPTARAVLPPQDVEGGVIQIRLIEATVGELKVEGLTRSSAAYIRNRMGVLSGELLSVEQLEERLIRFNRLHDAKLRARLAPGAEFGTTDVILDAIEPRPVELYFFTDNTRRRTIGRERVGGILRIPSMSGIQDTLLLSGDWSEGAESFSLAYSLPLFDSDIRFEFGFDYSGIEVVDGPLKPLDVTGRSLEFSFGLAAPLVVTMTEQVSVFGRVKMRESVSKFGGETVQKVDLRVINLGFNAQMIDSTGIWFTEQSFNFGINALGGDQDYFVYNGNVVRVQRVTRDLSFVARAGWQLSPERLLPSSEQFQVGGAHTVRGYSEGLLTGNRGYYVGLEGKVQLLPPETGLFGGSYDDRVELFGFIEHGGAFPFKPAGLGIDKDDFVTSAGFGIGFELFERVTGRVSVAFPFRANRFESGGMNPWIHFSVQVLAF